MKKFEGHSPSNIFLYSLLTLGLYQFYWIFIIEKNLFNKEVKEIIFQLLFFLIPLVNLFMWYNLIKRILEVCRTEQRETVSSLIWFKVGTNFVSGILTSFSLIVSSFILIVGIAYPMYYLQKQLINSKKLKIIK